MAAATKTWSTHRSAFVQATHRLDILGYSTLKSLGVRTSVRSGTFDAGGFPWTLVCCVDEVVKPGRRAATALASISLELSKNETDHDVLAMASLRIDEAAGTGQFPAAVWRSDEANTVRARSSSAVAWELSVPDAFRDHEAGYIDEDADCIAIHCTPKPKRGACHVAMAQDLLVAADLYDLERLRLMCEKILSENIDVDNVMTTLMQVHGRHSCRQLEASCIEFLASNPDVYDAVEATKEYKELKKDCGAFIIELTRKVARRAVARNSLSSSSSSLQPHTSASRYNPSTVFRGTHEFMIRNLNATRQERHVVDDFIRSGTFQIGGYEWAIDVYLWKKEDDVKEHIGVLLVLLNAPADAAVVTVKASMFFRIQDPNGKSHEVGHVAVYTGVRQSSGIQRFITLESATSEYVDMTDLSQ
ncbi:unnamed protein product [Alopecurus aequalis]